MKQDPIWFDAGDMNVYRYTWNNPLMWTDPSGMTGVEYANQNTLSRMMASGAVAAGAVYTASDAMRLMQSRSAIQAVGGGIACGFLTIAKALNIVSSGSFVGSIGNCSASEEPKGGGDSSSGGGSGGGGPGADGGGPPPSKGPPPPPPPPTQGPGSSTWEALKDIARQLKRNEPIRRQDAEALRDLAKELGMDARIEIGGPRSGTFRGIEHLNLPVHPRHIIIK